MLQPEMQGGSRLRLGSASALQNLLQTEDAAHLSFFLSAFFSMKPHTSAHTSMLVRKSSTAWRRTNAWLMMSRTRSKSKKKKRGAGQYFSVQAVVQLHQGSFGLLRQLGQYLGSDLRCKRRQSGTPGVTAAACQGAPQPHLAADGGRVLH